MTSEFEGATCEAEAARLLPWYVTGRLAAADRERVARHVEHCAICREDLAHEESMRTAVRAGGPVEFAPQAGLARTLARIDELTREAPLAAERPNAPESRRFSATQWLTAAVVVQAIGLGVLGATLVDRSAAERASPRYATLSAPAPAAGGPRIRAVFTPSLTLAELRGLLGGHHLQIVDGPTEAGAFTLASGDAADSARLDALLAGLRADARVLFAEPAVNDAVAPR